MHKASSADQKSHCNVKLKRLPLKRAFNYREHNSHVGTKILGDVHDHHLPSASEHFGSCLSSFRLETLLFNEPSEFSSEKKLPSLPSQVEHNLNHSTPCTMSGASHSRDARSLVLNTHVEHEYACHTQLRSRRLSKLARFPLR